MMIATLAFAIMQGFIKYVDHVHVFQIIFFRSSVTAVLSTITLLKVGVSLRGNRQSLLLLRSLFGVISMTLFFLTIQRIPFGTSVTLKYLSPFFTIILAVFVLGEKVKKAQWLLLLLALMGVILIKGFDDRIDQLSFIMSLAGAFFGGCVYVTIRKIGESEHPMVIINYFMISASIVSGLALLKYWKTPEINDLGVLILIGAIGFVGQKYMTTSLQISETNLVAPFKYTELIYAFLIGFVFFGESYSYIVIVGVILLMISCLGNMWVKQHR